MFECLFDRPFFDEQFSVVLVACKRRRLLTITYYLQILVKKRKLINDFINQACHSEKTEKRILVIKQSYDVSFVHFTKGYH